MEGGTPFTCLVLLLAHASMPKNANVSKKGGKWREEITRQVLALSRCIKMCIKRINKKYYTIFLGNIEYDFCLNVHVCFISYAIRSLDVET